MRTVEEALFSGKGRHLWALRPAAVIPQGALEWRVAGLLFQTTGAGTGGQQRIHYLLSVYPAVESTNIMRFRAFNQT